MPGQGFTNYNKKSAGGSQETGLLLDEVPPPPENLNDTGVLYWNFYCSMFLQGRVLNRMYLTSIHNLCIAHVLREAIMETMNTQGVMLTRTKNLGGLLVDEQYLNPLVEKLSKCLLSMDKLLASLGMTGYTNKVLGYDSSGGQLQKGRSKPPELTITPPPGIANVG